MIDAPYVCSSPHVVDGDSLRCGKERLRLLGIDAPELGPCPRHRRGQCASGDGEASRRSLQRAVGNGTLRYIVVSRDRFGRSVVMAWAERENLSCWQLKSGRAYYRPRWDDRRLVARTCPMQSLPKP